MSIGVSGERPKKHYEQLGEGVRVEVETLEQHPQATRLLNGAATELRPADGMQHLGSAAFHVYVSERTNLAGEKHISVVHQLSLSGMSEAIARTAVLEFNAAVFRSFGHEMKTTDKNYKVKT